MSIAIVTGSYGLVGSAVARALALQGITVVGVDNDQRSRLFGPAGSTAATGQALRRALGKQYNHHAFDIRDARAWASILQKYGSNVAAVVHTAAQPSHDWSASDPLVDFEINAIATLRMLQALRDANLNVPFVFMSTNKVYGDAVNCLDLREGPTRFDLEPEDLSYDGIQEHFGIDQSMHSPFGVSKLTADLAVQEYGRYYGLPTVCLRAGTITGGEHAAVSLHGFLAYLCTTIVRREEYTIIGYGGRQVRDVIHASDVANAIVLLVLNQPMPGSVFNIGGGRLRSCSVLEAIELCTQISGQRLTVTHSNHSRKGDHKWWITNTASFEQAYPAWQMKYTLEDMVTELLA